MAVKRKQNKPEIALRRLERVLHEAEGEMPRALMRMPDDAVKETERIKKSIRRLERLSRNEKFTMAIDPKTEGYMLDALSKDEYPDVRWGVAGNENVSVEISERLSEDEDASVRCNVAGNRNVSVEMLERLSRDEDASVRREVARSENASVEILERLKNDSDKGVRDMAMQLRLWKKYKENLK